MQTLEEVWMIIVKSRGQVIHGQVDDAFRKTQIGIQLKPGLIPSFREGKPCEPAAFLLA